MLKLESEKVIVMPLTDTKERRGRRTDAYTAVGLTESSAAALSKPTLDQSHKPRVTIVEVIMTARTTQTMTIVAVLFQQRASPRMITGPRP